VKNWTDILTRMFASPLDCLKHTTLYLWYRIPSKYCSHFVSCVYVVSYVMVMSGFIILYHDVNM
jgi:hypothetical protein